MEPATLGAFDVFLIVAYFLMVALVGLAFCVRERRKVRAGGDNASSTDDFFLAGRSMRWPSVGLSLFVSNIGSEHMLGLAGSAAASLPSLEKSTSSSRPLSSIAVKASRRLAEQSEEAAREAAEAAARAGREAHDSLQAQLRAAQAAAAEARAAQREAEEREAAAQRANAELRELESASASRLAQAEI